MSDLVTPHMVSVIIFNVLLLIKRQDAFCLYFRVGCNYVCINRTPPGCLLYFLSAFKYISILLIAETPLSVFVSACV